jgi:catechol 2,3-dioxygenase-like lactoylglutathione lyase family enzyme
MAELRRTTPVLRIFDEGKAREFYVGFLGFTIDFEHRFGGDFPIYLGVSRGACLLHLTEHHGDACAGATIRIETDDVHGLSAELGAKSYRYAKPGAPDIKPWGSIELSITDPFGNRLTFHQPGGA